MSQCFKCKQGIGTVVSRDGPKALYCVDCFLGYCTSAVRDGLFQQCYLACDTPVAVGVSGGPNSMLLLRELGQLRCKTQEQYRRQQRPTQRRTASAAAESVGAGSAPPPFPTGSTLALLPFHLCEAELVIPPALSSSSADTQHQQQQLTSAVARHAAVERVRASMQQQFDVLLKLVCQQPSLWVYHDESQAKKKQKDKKKSNVSTVASTGESTAGNNQTTTTTTTTAVAPDANTDSVEGAQTLLHLFNKDEVRIFHYSDFLPPSYMDEVRHALHASKLSLTDREALYDRVRQQVLCRAAQRVTDEYREGQGTASTVEETGTASSDALAGRVEDRQVQETQTASPCQPRAWCHLLLGDSAARCAIAALEAVVTGAGGDGVVHASAFRGLLHDVVCLRPMRTMLPRETVLSSRLHGISTSYTPALRTGTSLRSVRQVLEDFVHTMILSFRTMIFNVLNTVQRLEVHPGALQQLVQFVGQVGETDGGTATAPPLKAKGSVKAPPGRTAQQNWRELRSCQPPLVHHSPAASRNATLSGEGLAVQCCVCGCPASAPARDTERSNARQVEMFAVEDAEAAPSASPLDCFVCYACRSLLEAWPASAFGAAAPSSDATAEQRERNGQTVPMSPTAAPTNALRAGCSLFQ